jgi:biopolymer transport protein ExbD
MTKVNSTQLINLAVNKLKYEIHKQEVQGVPIELPEAHIRGDINTPYRCIGGAIFTMQRAGFARVGFISEPPPGYVTERL